PMMTGGMDNPVAVAFMPDGERILSGTFFHVNPRQDGLIHAVYGGVYGKENGVLEGHPRTGELMPILDPLGAAAACGLARYEGDGFGREYRDNLFLCQFNLRKVSRHILKPLGATYQTEDSDFVWSDFVDFHPTDVVEDADGSLLVVDTGGWYKLCCPTSQLWKPDVAGGIYRVRKIGAKLPADPRGRKIDWSNQTAEQLWTLLADNRQAVRRRASLEFVRRSGEPEGLGFLDRLRIENVTVNADGTISPAEITALARVWTLGQIQSETSRELLGKVFSTDSELVRHAILQIASLHPHSGILSNSVLEHASKSSSPAIRRAIAEALGRRGDQSEVPLLLEMAGGADSRVLQHSVIYALIELADSKATRLGLTAESPKVVAASLIALDQMPNGDIKPTDVIRHLGAKDSTLHEAAEWVVKQHPGWGGELTQWLDERLKATDNTKTADDSESDAGGGLIDMFVLFASNDSVQDLLASAVDHPTSAAAREIALRAMTKSKLQGPAKGWIGAIATAIANSDEKQLPIAIAAARRFPIKSAEDSKMSHALISIAENPDRPLEVRVEALAIVVGKQPTLSQRQFELLRSALASSNPVSVRSAAADAIAKSHLDRKQLDQLCEIVSSAGPLELNRLLEPFKQAKDEQLGLALVAAIEKSPALASLRMDLLREALGKYDPQVQDAVAKLEGKVNVDAASQRKRIEELLPYTAKGNVSRGHAVFYSAKATCTACHRLGYAGGTIGPELTHVGETRTARDLLESIVYPSLSFVRSYEPMLITTQEGKTINGVVKEDTATEYLVATGPDQFVRLRHEDVDEMQPSKVSIMPAGFDKQLTPEELGDLVAFLKNPTDSQKAKPQATK
ncbi:MAG TPA: HEAT repeat domain-containing protein, partial [Lacipirellulaceae bacterium]|nr:HEAT repeat domain-containing protein [Lacipirellulaceae bacterium]